ncbi:hypothetical protein RDI58_014002 [Solanum bulbocastanum]|uniref:Uncharacterized protein n=1 Tax=Solanum bulbocastanum TaxID=147425 RepID=A0AAN8TRS6_SOLBU
MVTNTGDNVDPELGVVAAGESSTENAFKDEYVPPWHKQITLRAMFTGFIVSVVFNFIVCKLNLNWCYPFSQCCCWTLGIRRN